MLTYLTSRGATWEHPQGGVGARDGLVGTIPFVRVETLPGQVGSIALSRA